MICSIITLINEHSGRFLLAINLAIWELGIDVSLVHRTLGIFEHAPSGNNDLMTYYMPIYEAEVTY